MSELMDFAQAGVQAASRAGAEFADAYCAEVQETSVEVEKSSINYCATIRGQGLSVRAFHRGGAGFASVQKLDLGEVRECAQRAVAMAKATHPDPDFVALPEPTEAQPVEGLWDEELVGLGADAAVQWCARGIEEARAVAEDAVVQGGAGLSSGQYALASSTGVCVGNRATSVSIGFFVIINRDGEVGSYVEQDMARRLSDFEPESVAEKAARDALRQLGARSVGTARMDIVLGPLAVMQLINSVVGAANAESVQRNRSFLVGRERERIASEALTVREEPLGPAGLRSSPWDAEGVARQPRTLIDRGVLSTYLHNSYTANKAGVANTAHATRGGYSGGVGIGATNLRVQPGERTEAELISEVDEGLYLSFAELAPNAVTGEVSATADFGFKIENGELAHPLSTTMIGSDAFELLGGIDAVSSDYREEPGILLPSLRISSVQVASQE